MSSRPINISDFLKFKQENKKITALTAYDFSTAKALDETGIDLILVGDSLAMVALGYETTHNVTVDEMIIFTKAVSRAISKSFVVADMPFMSYQTDKKTAMKNAGKFIKEANAKAVKIEGGSDYIVDLVEHMTQSGIPVLAHLGFTPQYLHTLGGYKIQGKTFDNTKVILEQAKKLEKAGAFGLVLEMVPQEAAKIITENLNIPTIGIGAGKYTSGQILVTDDVLGKYSNFTPKFARQYTNLSAEMTKAFENYKSDVENIEFPNNNEVFSLTKEEKEKLENAYN